MKGPLILLVDDNPTGRKLAALQLTAAGYRVETAAGAREALEKARSLNLQAIISDVVMDDIDGFRFCQQLRSNQALAKVPVVLVSSHVDGAAERRLARECGASELVLRTPDFSAELSALEASFARAPPAKSLSDAELDADHLSANAHQLVMLAERARRAEQRYRACSNARPMCSPSSTATAPSSRSTAAPRRCSTPRRKRWSGAASVRLRRPGSSS